MCFDDMKYSICTHYGYSIPVVLHHVLKGEPSGSALAGIWVLYGIWGVSSRPPDIMILHAFDDMKTHDLMYSDYMIMVISSTSPDPLETMGITTYAIRSTHALQGTYIIG